MARGNTTEKPGSKAGATGDQLGHGSDTRPAGEYGYGGDFGKLSGKQDRNFIVDGILFPDRTPHPAYQDDSFGDSTPAGNPCLAGIQKAAAASGLPAAQDHGRRCGLPSG